MAIGRRKFIKTASVGAAGLTLGGGYITKTDATARKQSAWSNGMAVNPDISNTKVVCCYDAEMYDGETSGNFSIVNERVNDEKVYAAMDFAAMQLAGKTTPDKAWQTIFRSGKAWSETRVAIRVNCINKEHMNRVAVVKKISDVMVGFGVPPENVIIFDACMDASGSDKFTPYASVTDESLIRGRVSVKSGFLGGTADVDISGVTGVVCPKDLLEGNVDILVNIAINKGHGMGFSGNATLCLKHHLGTFVNSDERSSSRLHSTDALFAINKHDVILGGSPVRQQLCIIDTILASRRGPGDPPDKAENGGKPCRIIMGTFAGAVDYCCVKKIREELNGWTHDDGIVNRFLSEFGYSEADIEWEEFIPTSVTMAKRSDPASFRMVKVTLSHPSYRVSSAALSLPTGVRVARVTIYDLKGTRIFVADTRIDARNGIVWNGRTDGGTSVSPGRYVVKVAAGTVAQSGYLAVNR